MRGRRRPCGVGASAVRVGCAVLGWSRIVLRIRPGLRCRRIYGIALKNSGSARLGDILPRTAILQPDRQDIHHLGTSPRPSPADDRPH